MIIFTKIGSIKDGGLKVIIIVFLRIHISIYYNFNFKIECKPTNLKQITSLYSMYQHPLSDVSRALVLNFILDDISHIPYLKKCISFRRSLDSVCPDWLLWYQKYDCASSEKDKGKHKPYLGQVFSDSSLDPLCSLCFSRSCPRFQKGKRSLAAPWGSFWTSCPGSPCHPSLSLVHFSAPSLPSLGCTWPPCSVYPLGPAACQPLFFPLSGEKKEDYGEHSAPDRLDSVGFSFKTAPFSRAESAI